jgi:hypothetical protein
MLMGDPRELEWAKKPDALKEGWTARTGTHMVHCPLTIIIVGTDMFTRFHPID